MAIARQSFTEGGVTGAVLYVTVESCAANDTLLVALRWYGTQTVSSIACSGETVTMLGSPQTGGPSDGRIQFAVIEDVQGSGSLLIEATMSAAPTTGGAACAWRLTGCDNADAVDGSPVGASGTGSTPTVNITTSLSGAALLGFCINGSGNIVEGSGFTSETNNNVVWYEDAEYDIDAGSAGSKTIAFGATANDWALAGVALNSADGVAGITLTGSASTVPNDGVTSPGTSVEL